MPWLESIPHPALRCDAEGRILAVNRRAVDQLGRCSDELVGRAWSEFGGAAGVEADLVTSRAWLRAWLERPEIREALWISSPSLVESADG